MLHVLRVMAASRISLLPIERTLEDSQTTFTVGLLFLNDLLYLLGTPNFWECLNDPVVDFFKELYGPNEYLDVVSNYCSDTSTSQRQEHMNEGEDHKSGMIKHASDAKMHSTNKLEAPLGRATKEDGGSESFTSEVNSDSAGEA